MRANVDFTVEPFAEGKPGPHVQAAIRALAVLDPDVGPFGTTVEGDLDETMQVVRDGVAAAVSAGATRVVVSITVTP